eukprot:499254-Amphidinium_carterae.1
MFCSQRSSESARSPLSNAKLRICYISTKRLADLEPVRGSYSRTSLRQSSYPCPVGVLVNIVCARPSSSIANK